MSNVPPSLWDSVSNREALSVDCPKCGRPAGKRCVYLANIYLYTSYPHYQKTLKHRKGAQTQRVHAPRRRVFSAQRLASWRLEHKAEAAKLDAAGSRQRRQMCPVFAAEAEFARREREALRQWLLDYGEILWAEAV
jgi:hypothetical protein